MKLMPSPKWKLVVDLGEPKPAILSTNNDNSSQQENASGTDSNSEKNQQEKDPRIDQVVSILGEYMPSDPSSPLGSYIPAFMTLRLMLLRPTWTEQESDLVRTMLGSYSSYLSTGRSRSDIALLLARDCMFLQSQGTGAAITNNVGGQSPTDLSMNQVPKFEPQPFFSLSSSPSDNNFSPSKNMLTTGGKMPQASTTQMRDSSISIVSN